MPPPLRASTRIVVAGASARGWTNLMRLGSSEFAPRHPSSSALRAASKTKIAFAPLAA